MPTDSSNAERRATRIAVLRLVFEHIELGNQGDLENRRRISDVAGAWVEWVETGYMPSCAADVGIQQPA